MTRLTDDDRHFGPITYARCNPSWSQLRVVYSSGAHEDCRGPVPRMVPLRGDT